MRAFWNAHGWLASLPYLYAYDEPGPGQRDLVGRQASALHECFPGGKAMVTAAPTAANTSLRDGTGEDDIDVWTVHVNRYGEFTVPKASAIGVSRARDQLKRLNAARRLGHSIWAYTYQNPWTPNFQATEPLSDSRMLFLWAALEKVKGILYAQGMTTYGSGNPYQRIATDGWNVLLYPGFSEPVPSARLEQSAMGSKIGSCWILSGAGGAKLLCGGSSVKPGSSASAPAVCNSAAPSAVTSKPPRRSPGRFIHATQLPLPVSRRQSSQRLQPTRL